MFGWNSGMPVSKSTWLPARGAEDRGGGCGGGKPGKAENTRVGGCGGVWCSQRGSVRAVSRIVQEDYLGLCPTERKQDRRRVVFTRRQPVDLARAPEPRRAPRAERPPTHAPVFLRRALKIAAHRHSVCLSVYPAVRAPDRCSRRRSSRIAIRSDWTRHCAMIKIRLGCYEFRTESGWNKAVSSIKISRSFALIYGIFVARSLAI